MPRNAADAPSASIRAAKIMFALSESDAASVIIMMML
jgi:hypothetical protein